jgi:DNA-binding transcriptional regulator GbsR (MarR family)
MGSRWGVNRTVAQVHALLYLAARPMDAEEITDTLGVARSNVSNSLKELQSWHLVKVVHIKGERRDYFETSTDIWELFKLIVAGRRRVRSIRRPLRCGNASTTRQSAKKTPERASVSRKP